MGNKASGQSFPTDAVIAESVRAMNTFGVLYIKAYSIALLRSKQREREVTLEGVERGLNKEGYKLARPPTAAEPMERGYVTKLGAIKKNWKRRFFVATEEMDNFVVYYFERQEDSTNPTKAKGCIYPCGYIVRPADPEVDGKDIGEYALCLEPLDRKRTWYLRFDTPEERAIWKQVLQYSALHCQPPLSMDSVMAEAFKQAYERTRRQFGLHGYHVLDRAEQDQLAVLAAQICENSVLSTIYDSLASIAASMSGGAAGAAASPPPAGSKAAMDADKTRAAVDKELERIVGELAASVWPALTARLELRREAIDRLLTTSMGAIQHEEDVRKGEIRERTTKDLRGVAREVAGPVVGVVLGALLKPLYKAHKEAIKVFWNRVHSIIEHGLREGDLRAFYRDVRWQHGALAPAFRKVGVVRNEGEAHCRSHVLVPPHPMQIRALTRGEVDETDAGDAALKLLSDLTVPLPELVSLMQGVTLWEVETLFEEHLRQLIGWGVYSFVAAVETSRGGVTPVACLHSVMRNVLHDSKIRQRNNLVHIFRMILFPSLRQRATALPVVKSILDTSVAWKGGNFEVVPPPARSPPTSPAAGAAAAAAPASSSAGGAVPTATPVRVNKKTKAAAEAEVTSAPVSETFLDTDWMMDEVFEEVLDSVVSGIIDSRVSSVLARLDKLPGKLGFASA